ncbi:MAG: hypothetical protein HFH87_06160 [Lachnospiraceae bacterium]|nr:hypothetical protein [Lachnospiraceae bacterium]
MDYIYNMFFPYISEVPDETKIYEKLFFYKDQQGELYVEGTYKKEKSEVGIIPYIEDYLLVNAVLEKGYLMLHGGSVAHNEFAFVFLADSMMGKSTMMTHLCMNGFEYITDDRLLIDTVNGVILPYNKTIMLRPEGKKVLYEKYNHSFPTTLYHYGKINREFYFPELCRKKATKISKIFILERREEHKLRIETIKNSERLQELLKYSLSIRSCRYLCDYVSLCDIGIEKIYYFDLDEVSNFLKTYG